MSDELLIVNTDLPQRFDPNSFSKVSASSGFLPRLQLFGSNAKAVKQDKIGQGRYGLVDGDKIDDLEKSVDVIVVDWRPKAMRIPGDGNVFSYFNVESPEFEKVQLESDQPDSGCMFGPEFLVYIPSREKFATFYMGSKSARRESDSVHRLLHRAATLKVKLVETKKYQWHAPVVTPCSTPPVNRPTPEQVTEQMKKFRDVKDSEVEKAESDAGDGRDR